MEIYKARYFVTKRRKNGKVDFSWRGHSGEAVVIDNLETAKGEYARFLNECKQYDEEGCYQGACELFVPAIYTDGKLAYFPENDKYIERFTFGRMK